MRNPRNILGRHDLRPLKRYGQSFLADANIMRRIVDALGIGTDDVVVEIGAGIGTLTGMLAERASRVIALEIDRRMVSVLAGETAQWPNIVIVPGDVLTFDFSSVAAEPGGTVLVVGNVPYNISSQILVRLIHFRDCYSAAVLMFQKELAERITALPGSSRYGSLSVLAALYLTTSKVMTVPPKAFFPPPKVHSMVLRLEPRDRPLHAVHDHEQFRAIVRAAFAHRRKTLLNSLKDNPHAVIGHEQAMQLLHNIGIDPRRRGETLTIDEFARLANAISAAVDEGGVAPTHSPSIIRD